MLQVIRKDERESIENLIRRFNRKVQQSGVLAIAKKKQFFEKALGKREQREIAIRKRIHKEDKIKKMYFSK